MGQQALGNVVIDPKNVCLFVPPGLKKFKLDLFERIGKKVQEAGGKMVRHSFEELGRLPSDVMPIIGCTPELRPLVLKWRAEGHKFIYWDRGYARRVFATYLPRGDNGGYYRWHIDSFQMTQIWSRPDDRWRALDIALSPWKKNGRQVVVLAPTPTYQKYHAVEDWVENTTRALAELTDRQIVVRFKNSKRTLHDDLEGAHAVVANGTIAAVEAAILGYPVFDAVGSAAALVGQTDLTKIENPVYPDREPWVRSLAYCQFNEDELVNGTLWKLIT